MDQADQIIDEIVQIIEQYKKEVPDSGKVWPVSIRERVRQLSRLDISCREISRRTGIPAPTVYVWASGKVFKRKPKGTTGGKFLPVQVSANVESEQIENRQNLAARNLAAKLPNLPEAFTAVLPGGIRVDGLTLDSLIQLSRRMSS